MSTASHRRSPEPAVLLAGPWCWPRAGTIRFETLLLAHGPPPGPAPGHVAAVTVRGHTTTLWHLQPAATARTGTSTRGRTALGAEARASWEAAGIALPRSLPVLWRSVNEATHHLPTVRRLVTSLDGPGFAEHDAVVDGPSFGLAFFLLLASSVLDCPVPGDVIASARIDAFGRLSAVDGLRQKVDGICALAPAVTRLVVSAGQADEASRHARGRLAVVGAANAAEALEHVFGARLSQLLVDAGTEPARRRELTSSFFRLALIGRGAAIDWSPVARGAAQALEAWTDLDAESRYQLEFARAVASRHESNEGTLPLPEPSWLAGRPRVLRVHLLSHLVQQAADTGTPAPDLVEPLAAAELAADPREAFVSQLRLHGALCRLWALTGRAADALRDTARLTTTLADVYALVDASFPLSEWLRLAGALADREAFAAAARMRQQLLTQGGFGEHGGPYVDLSYARARLCLNAEDREGLAIAGRLADDPAVPAHVRWSAHRWAGDRVASRLREESARAPMARRYDVLARLDAAVAAHDRAEADRRVEELTILDPGPLGHLRRHGADAAAVARLYPY